MKTCVDIDQVKEELQQLPPTLEGMYDRILLDIKPHHHTRVMRILQFLVYSNRPLKLEELVDAIAVNVVSTPAFEPRRRMPDPDDILSMCPSLLARTAAPDDTTTGGRGMIALAHATVKEYLVSLDRNSIFYNVADSTMAQGSIATVCLAYLSELGSREDCGELFVGRLRTEFPLAYFAARYWVRHARVSDGLVEVKEAAVKFLTNRETMRIWTSLYNPDFPWRGEIPVPSSSTNTIASPVYYTSLGGLTHTLDTLLQKGSGPDGSNELLESGGAYHTALQAASIGGHKEVVRRLLEQRGVDVNTVGGLYGSALQAAAVRGNPDIVSLLLEHGADVNIPGGRYGHALQAAAACGRSQALRLLLEHGADPNGPSRGIYPTALYAACVHGYEPCVRMLIDSGAECDGKDKDNDDGRVPLQAASERGHISIASQLLLQGASINRGGSLYRNAAARGHTAMMRLLLNRGADVDATGGLFGTALQAASVRGDRLAVRLLIEAGADVNLREAGSRSGLRPPTASLR